MDAVSAYQSGETARGLAGIIIFSAIDFMYLFAVTLFIFSLIDAFRQIVRGRVRANITEEEDRKERFYILLASFAIAAYLAYITTGMDGYISIIQLIRSIISSF